MPSVVHQQFDIFDHINILCTTDRLIVPGKLPSSSADVDEDRLKSDLEVAIQEVSACATLSVMLLQWPLWMRLQTVNFAKYSSYF